MSLTTGMRVRLLSIDAAMIVGSDWMNERSPGIGDVAIIEGVSKHADGTIFRLLCERKAGFLIWRVDVWGRGFTFEVLL